MKLFSAELRQLFNVRFLLVVALASIVYAYSLLTFSNESLETYLSPPDGSTTSNTDIEKHLADSVLGDGRLSVTEEDLDVLSEEMTKTEELDAFFRNTEAFRQYGVSSLEDYKKLEKEVEALIPEGLCASVYTQLSDVEEEVNGVFTYDREVRKIGDALYKCRTYL